MVETQNFILSIKVMSGVFNSIVQKRQWREIALGLLLLKSIFAIQTTMNLFGVLIFKIKVFGMLKRRRHLRALGNRLVSLAIGSYSLKQSIRCHYQSIP